MTRFVHRLNSRVCSRSSKPQPLSSISRAFDGLVLVSWKRVTLQTPEYAATRCESARASLIATLPRYVHNVHNAVAIRDCPISVVLLLIMYSQQIGPQDNVVRDTTHLMPPIQSRQFLISPPASPPVGWAPSQEGEPIINYDILTAISQLEPGETHELHAPSESQPGIMVHVCEDQNNRLGLLGLPNEVEERKTKEQKGKIIPTRCPPTTMTHS